MGCWTCARFGKGSFWHAVRYLSAVMWGTHQRLGECDVRQDRDDPVGIR